MPDNRWYKSQDEYTTNEHLLSIREAIVIRSGDAAPLQRLHANLIERVGSEVSHGLDDITDNLRV